MPVVPLWKMHDYFEKLRQHTHRKRAVEPRVHDDGDIVGHWGLRWNHVVTPECKHLIEGTQRHTKLLHSRSVVECQSAVFVHHHVFDKFALRQHCQELCVCVIDMRRR